MKFNKLSKIRRLICNNIPATTICNDIMVLYKKYKGILSLSEIKETYQMLPNNQAIYCLQVINDMRIQYGASVPIYELLDKLKRRK